MQTPEGLEGQALAAFESKRLEELQKKQQALKE